MQHALFVLTFFYNKLEDFISICNEVETFKVVVKYFIALVNYLDWGSFHSVSGFGTS